MTNTNTKLTADHLIEAARVNSVTIHEGHASVTDLNHAWSTIHAIALGSKGDLNYINMWAGREAIELENEGRNRRAEIFNQIAYWSWCATEGHEWALASYRRIMARASREG